VDWTQKLANGQSLFQQSMSMSQIHLVNRWLARPLNQLVAVYRLADETFGILAMMSEDAIYYKAIQFD
jgi:hypothetical protein